MNSVIKKARRDSCGLLFSIIYVPLRPSNPERWRLKRSNRRWPCRTGSPAAVKIPALNNVFSVHLLNYRRALSLSCVCGSQSKQVRTSEVPTAVRRRGDCRCASAGEASDGRPVRRCHHNGCGRCAKSQHLCLALSPSPRPVIEARPPVGCPVRLLDSNHACPAAADPGEALSTPQRRRR